MSDKNDGFTRMKSFLIDLKDSIKSLYLLSSSSSSAFFIVIKELSFFGVYAAKFLIYVSTLTAFDFRDKANNVSDTDKKVMIKHDKLITALLYSNFA